MNKKVIIGVIGTLIFIAIIVAVIYINANKSNPVDVLTAYFSYLKNRRI